MPSTVLITGGNRGLGKSFVEAYLSVPNTTVVVTVRDPSISQSLSALPAAAGSRLIIVKMEMASSESIVSGIETLKTTHGINAIDTVIANAGISGPTPSLAQAPVAEIQKYIDVNAYGPLELFKATLPLLRSASIDGNKAKFVLVSSAGGSLTNMYDFMPLAAYGASKALANFFTKWLSLEHKDLIVWAHNPGPIDTDMTSGSQELAESLGMDLSSMVFTPPEEVASVMKKVIDGATEGISGKFIDRDGTEIVW